MNFNIGDFDLRKPVAPREKKLFALVMLGSILFFYRSCWAPTQKAIEITKSNMVVLSAQLDGLKELANIPVEKRQIQAPIEPQKTGVLARARLFKASKTSEAMAYFFDPLILQGVKITEFNFLELETDKGWIKQKIELTAQGSFMRVGAYLKSLENFPLIFAIENLVLKPLVENKPGQIVASIKGSVYGLEK